MPVVGIKRCSTVQVVSDLKGSNSIDFGKQDVEIKRMYALILRKESIDNSATGDNWQTTVTKSGRDDVGGSAIKAIST